MLESIPPESSAPSGTSATSRLRTAAPTVVRTRSSHSLFVCARFGVLRLPIALDPFRPALCDEHVPGRKLVDPAQRGAVAGNVLQREERVDRLEVDLARDLRQAQQRLQLGGEGNRAVREARPEQRLLAEPVACEHEPFASRVPEREREHPVEPFDEARPALLVEMRQDRRVAGPAYLVRAQSPHAVSGSCRSRRCRRQRRRRSRSQPAGSRSSRSMTLSRWWPSTQCPNESVEPSSGPRWSSAARMASTCSGFGVPVGE